MWLQAMTYTSVKQPLPVGKKPVLFYGLVVIRDATSVSSSAMPLLRSARPSVMSGSSG